MLSTQPANRNGFPAELDDRDWLVARCGKLGEETIAAELGVSRKAIRRARDRLRIPQPMPKSGSNGSSRHPAPSSNGSGKPTASKAKSARPLASDQELAKRVGNVKKGLEVVAATLVRLVNEMEWVGDQVQPHTTRPAPAAASSEPASAPVPVPAPAQSASD